MADLEKMLADNLGDPTPSPSGSSEGTARPLSHLRGINPAFGVLDEENEVQESEAPAPAAEEQSEEVSGRSTSEEKTSDGAGEGSLDADVVALQKRLIDSDKTRAKVVQERAQLRNKLVELDPFIKLGISVTKNPRAYQAVQKILSGQDITEAEAGSVDRAAASQGMSPQRLLAEVNRLVQEGVSTQLNAHTAATRSWTKLENRARKELVHFDALQEHPDYLAHVDLVQEGIDRGTFEVPDGEDRNFFALSKAHDLLVASKPDYIEAVRKLGVEQGKTSVAKKLAAAGPNGASRGSANAGGETKLSSDEQGRINMIRAWTGASSKHRLPSARR